MVLPVQCIVPLLFYGHLLSMDSAITGLKTSHMWTPDQLVEFHSKDQSPPAKDSPATATRLIKHEHLVYMYIQY